MPTYAIDVTQIDGEMRTLFLTNQPRQSGAGARLVFLDRAGEGATGKVDKAL